MPDWAKAATKAATNPVGAATDLISGVLGIGKGPPWAASHRRAREAYARRDWPYLLRVAMPKDQGGTKFPQTRNYVYIVLRREGFTQQPDYTWRAPSWVGNISPAPSAGPSTPSAAPTAPSSPPSAPAAPKPTAAERRRLLGPCIHGERVPPDYYCPKKAKAAPVSGNGAAAPLGPTSAAEKRRLQGPCVYGERVPPDYYCPKRGAAAAGGGNGGIVSGVKADLLRRAQTIGGNIAVAGARGLGQAIKAAWQSGALKAPTRAGLAAAGTTVALVAAAATVGWLIGQAINDRHENRQIREGNAARDRRTALAELRKKLGRPLGWGGYPSGISPAEQAEITKAYNHRMKLIRGGLG